LIFIIYEKLKFITYGNLRKKYSKIIILLNYVAFHITIKIVRKL
jgi:hypothetical protein